MIGIWNYTVVLTYISLASSAYGMVLALNNKIISALLCLAFSGLCDAFDGRIARSKKRPYRFGNPVRHTTRLPLRRNLLWFPARLDLLSARA